MNNNSVLLNNNTFPRDLGDSIEFLPGIILKKSKTQFTQQDINRFNRELEEQDMEQPIYPRARFGFDRW